MRPSRILAGLALCAGQAVAADSYDTYVVRLDGGAGSAVITSLGGKVQRVLVDLYDKLGGVQYAVYGGIATLDHLQVPARARGFQGSANGGVTGSGTAWRLEDKGIDKAWPEASEVQVALSGAGALSGTISVGGKTYKASGYVRRDADGTKDGLQAGADWPVFNGPNGDFTAAVLAKPPKMIAQVEDIRLLWVSQDLMPHMAAGARFRLGPHGGCSTPVIKDGRLYQTYYVPAGQWKDAERATQRRDPTPEPWNTWLGDEVVVAIDAATGKTLWRTVLPLAGINTGCHKSHSQGREPVAAGDAVYVVTSAAQVLSLDAASGKLRWQVASPVGGRQGEAYIAEAKAGKVPSGNASNRNSGHRPTWAGGVLVVSAVYGGWDGNDVAGLDPASGKTLWTRQNIQEECASPLVWRHGGKDLLMVTGPVGKENPRSTLRCLDPANGTDVWTVPDLGKMAYGPTLHGDQVFVNIGGGSGQDDVMGADSGQMACYSLRPAGAVKTWEVSTKNPSVHAHFSGSCAMQVDGQVFARLFNPGEKGDKGYANGPVVLDPASGAIKAGPLTMSFGSNEGTAMGHQGLLVWFREYQHGGTEPMLFATQPLTALGRWKPNPYLSSTGYQSPSAPPLADGRIFLRGTDGIYCFDLRAPR
jgi:outer membrane protein assembly factor BamB